MYFVFKGSDKEGIIKTQWILRESFQFTLIPFNLAFHVILCITLKELSFLLKSQSVAAGGILLVKYKWFSVSPSWYIGMPCCPSKSLCVWVPVKERKGRVYGNGYWSGRSVSHELEMPFHNSRVTEWEKAWHHLKSIWKQSVILKRQ